MRLSRRAPLTILADDLTGACDTGALFAGRGPVPVTVWPRPPTDASARVADLESRTAPAAVAAGRVTELVASVRTGHWLKKIDSTLRGRVGAELDALMRALGAPTALVCPALPAQGRVVVDRVLMVDGVPVAETALGRDAEFPAGGSSSVVEILRPQIDRALAWIPIEQVRAGRAALSARLKRLAGTVIVADAETDADLDTLVAAALATERPPVLAGAAGLARALAARLGLAGERVDLPGGRWLVVAGSLHPATRRQIREARAAGLTVLATAERPAADRGAAVTRLAEQALAALERERWGLVVVTGGETAAALWAALGAERLDLAGAPLPGLAFGHLQAPGRDPLPVLTKAGGFGPPDLLVALQKEGVA
jgi:uncharacterized protein YgbK (DUF1537 family)